MGKSIWLGEYADSELPRPLYPDRPQLLLGRCRGDPLEYIAKLNNGEIDGSDFAQEHGIVPRLDLLADLPMELRNTIHDSSKEDLQRIKEYLIAENNVVDMNKGNIIYTIYVINLEETPDEPDDSRGSIYVGQTALSKEERFENHKNGHKGSKWVKKYGIDINEELCESSPQVRTLQEAEDLEAKAASQLEEDGWTVKGGH